MLWVIAVLKGKTLLHLHLSNLKICIKTDKYLKRVVIPFTLHKAPAEEKTAPKHDATTAMLYSRAVLFLCLLELAEKYSCCINRESSIKAQECIVTSIQRK